MRAEAKSVAVCVEDIVLRAAPGGGGRPIAVNFRRRSGPARVGVARRARGLANRHEAATRIRLNIGQSFLAAVLPPLVLALEFVSRYGQCLRRPSGHAKVTGA